MKTTSAGYTVPSAGVNAKSVTVLIQRPAGTFVENSDRFLGIECASSKPHQFAPKGVSDEMSLLVLAVSRSVPDATLRRARQR
jgi:hypothetical protein